MRRQRLAGSAQGFTLIELVIALAIVATMLAIMFGGLRVGLAAWRQGDARAESLQHSRSLSQLLVRALGGVHPYRAAASGGEASQLVFKGDGDRLAFVTSTPPVPFPTPIAFTAVTVSREESGLIVRQKALPNQEPFELVAPMLADASVTEIRFRYRSPDDGTWQGHWDTAAEQALPPAIEITLTTEQGGRRIEHAPIVVAFRVSTP